MSWMSSCVLIGALLIPASDLPAWIPVEGLHDSLPASPILLPHCSENPPTISAEDTPIFDHWKSALPPKLWNMQQLIACGDRRHETFIPRGADDDVVKPAWGWFSLTVGVFLLFAGQSGMLTRIVMSFWYRG